MKKCQKDMDGEKMNKQDVIKKIDEYKIITIVRGLTKEQLIPTVEAMYNGGIRLVEVTFDQSGKFSEEYVANQIKLIDEKFDGKVLVGAGTVMTKKQVEIAKNAGAKYIISPNTDKDVIKYTVESGLVSIPGALTPTEAANAHSWGADYVKMFPAGELGISYIKAIKAPLLHIKMLAVGGIDEKNLADFLNAGICGIGVGSNIVKKNLIENNEYDKITELAKKYTEQI